MVLGIECEQRLCQRGAPCMIEVQSITDLQLLRESVDLQFKLAAGRDGQSGMVCQLTGDGTPTSDDVFEPPPRISAATSLNLDRSSPHLEASSLHLNVLATVSIRRGLTP